MKRTFSILFLGICMVAVGIVTADAQGPSNGKIGVVDLQRTLKETRVGKNAKKKLEADKVKKQRALDKDQKALQRFAAELDKQRAVLKPNVLRQRERQLQEKYVKLQETYLKLQQDLAQMEAKLVQDIFRKASPVIQQIAKEKGFAMIVEKNEGAVLFATKALDITDAVNQRVK